MTGRRQARQVESENGLSKISRGQDARVGVSPFDGGGGIARTTAYILPENLLAHRPRRPVCAARSSGPWPI